MEITLYVLDDRTKHYKDIKADSEDFIYYNTDVENLVMYNRDQSIENYLRDRFNDVPEINRGHYPRFMGKVTDLLDILKVDKSHFLSWLKARQYKMSFDRFWEHKIKTCYLTSTTPFPKLIEEVSELIGLLEELEDKDHKEILLVWL